MPRQEVSHLVSYGETPHFSRRAAKKPLQMPNPTPADHLWWRKGHMHKQQHHKSPTEVPIDTKAVVNSLLLHPLPERPGEKTEGELRSFRQSRLHSHANIWLWGLGLASLPWDQNDLSWALNKASQIGFATAHVMDVSPSNLAHITPINLGAAPEA